MTYILYKKTRHIKRNTGEFSNQDDHNRMNERHPQTIEFAHPIIYSLAFF